MLRDFYIGPEGTIKSDERYSEGTSLKSAIPVIVWKVHM